MNSRFSQPKLAFLDQKKMFCRQKFDFLIDKLVFSPKICFCWTKIWFSRPKLASLGFSWPKINFSRPKMCFLSQKFDFLVKKIGICRQKLVQRKFVAIFLVDEHLSTFFRQQKCAVVFVVDKNCWFYPKTIKRPLRVDFSCMWHDRFHACGYSSTFCNPEKRRRNNNNNNNINYKKRNEKIKLMFGLAIGCVWCHQTNIIFFLLWSK